MNEELHICFKDYNKTFDKVRHDKLQEILMKINVDLRDIRIISKLYYSQKAAMWVEDI